MATELSEGEEEGKVTGGNQVLIVEDDLIEMGKAAWSVSSCKPGNGVSAFRDENLETYWQSDGAQPHLVNIQFQKKVKLQLDESYTPSKISIRASDGFHNLKFIEAEVYRDKRIKGYAEEVGSKVFEKSSREASAILQKRIPRPLIATA
ncbi:hypothetical protein CMV_006195 [Castanea mollissima]|uniref:DOC domain-containing protein n=1 Tax=Castanea mollissima TaxID=60419 RepID=A0A8J4VTN5_9ROSI|nr:hypothetical protein CMV_006195 [Castanea mollissima]